MLLGVGLVFYFFFQFSKNAKKRQREGGGSPGGFEQFVRAIFGGYLILALFTIVGFVVVGGVAGLQSALLIVLFSPIYAIPIFLCALLVGYPAYRFSTRGSKLFLVIWIGYTLAAFASATLYLLLMTLTGLVQPDWNGMTTAAWLTHLPALLVAIPSSILAWRFASRNPDPETTTAAQGRR